MNRTVMRGVLAAVLSLAGLGGLLLLRPAPSRSAQAPDPGRQDAATVQWLEEHAMLHQARQTGIGLSGEPAQWQHPYGERQNREALKQASVWLLDYPGSVIPRPGQTVIATWGSPELWDLLQNLGIQMLHTGPLGRAGGVTAGEKFTPSTDGWFDRISLELDPGLGSEAEYARMVAVAAGHGAGIAGDLVPLHTGTGADFYLALRNHGDYPGMYTLVEIAREDWGLLPEVRDPWGVALVPRPAAEQLTRKGYLPGLISSCDAAPSAKTWSGWSATGVVRGDDGKERRWVYLHYFKPSQPTLNWLDPTFAAQRAVGGDVVRTVFRRKTKVVRLDAVPFLGIERKPGTTDTLNYQHPLSISATNYLAFLVRKLGGWSFQELNVPLPSLKNYTKDGPDFSYDFITRAQILDALLKEDAAPLRLAFRWLLEADVQPATLVHDLQNHDEITFQLVEVDFRKEERLTVGAHKMTGKELKERMLADMRAKTAGPAAPYNYLYRAEKDGVATTFAGFIAPALGIADPYHATPEQVALIRRGHLLLAAANALQPGVFSLSSWDLVGALPVPLEGVKQWIGEGDYRWVNRGGVDLLGANPEARASAIGVPRAPMLYGPLPQQVNDPHSFAAQLRRLLAVRKQAEVAEAELISVPEPKAPGLCLLELRLPDGRPALTVLNFGRQDVAEEVDLAQGGTWTDLLTEKRVEQGEGGKSQVTVPALGWTLLVGTAKAK